MLVRFEAYAFETGFHIIRQTDRMVRDVMCVCALSCHAFIVLRLYYFKQSDKSVANWTFELSICNQSFLILLDRMAFSHH